MGNARARGTYEQRKEQAINAGRDHQVVRRPRKNWTVPTAQSILKDMLAAVAPPRTEKDKKIAKLKAIMDKNKAEAAETAPDAAV